VTLPLAFDLLIKTFNLGCIFWMGCTRALVFHMNIPSDPTFQWVHTFFTLWPWLWCLTYLLKTFNLDYIFWMAGTRTLAFHMSISCNTTFTWVPNIDLVTLILVLDQLIYNFNLGYIFKMYALGLWYYECFFWQDLSIGIERFDLVILTLVFDLHIEDFNHAYIFFQWYIQGFWHFTWMFVVTNSFGGYKQVWSCDLDLYL
jgi:hypothetical protein